MHKRLDRDIEALHLFLSNGVQARRRCECGSLSCKLNLFVVRWHEVRLGPRKAHGSPAEGVQRGLGAPSDALEK